MTRRNPVEWLRLDNAAKIFPANSNEKDTKVFRFLAQMKDEVDPVLLQEALNHTLERFPFYRSVLRRGVFWYYFERTDLKAEVRQEEKVPCSMLYHPGRRNLLFEVTYNNNRINLEVFHSLSDGTGALVFLKTLLYYYITNGNKEVFKDKLPALDYDASITQKVDDSFAKHYTGNKKPKRIKLRKAYRILGRRANDNRIKVIEGQMPVKEVIDLAHRHSCTLTIYLTALFLQSIYKEMSEKNRKYPVILSVPVNLRTYFPSLTARNFFATISISYDFSKKPDTLEEMIPHVKASFEQELTQEKLKQHMNRLTALEHNAMMRVVPLYLKDIVLRFASYLSDRGITATLSNVGKVSMAQELTPYVSLFNCFTSARRPQIALCSFQDKLMVSFSSPFTGTDIQKEFFRSLAREGVSIMITSNANE